MASTERYFSKLKLIQSYLRTSMTQERINSLTILFIERHYNMNLQKIKQGNSTLYNLCKR